MTADDIVSIALREVGVVESPAGSNRQAYGAAYGWNGVPWCVMFVWWCFAECGGSGLFYGGRKTASCSQLTEYHKARGQWVASEYKRGDLAMMTWKKNRAIQHVGIVESVSADGRTLYTIEGNTSVTSNDNGGAVMRRERPVSCVVGAVRPRYARPQAGMQSATGGAPEVPSEANTAGAEAALSAEHEIPNDKPEGRDKSMNIVRGSTASEKAMIRAIQTATGAVADGDIGTQTMSDIAVRLNAKCFPLTLLIYNMPVIIAKDITPIASPKKGLAAFANSMNGGFYAGGRPCSICVIDGKVVQHTACHAFDGPGYPESVLYRTKGGTIGIARVMNTSALPEDVTWAVGGMGLLSMYDPAAEGFTGKFSDVLRDTNHALLGVKNGYVYMAYCKSMTGAQVNAFAKKLKLEKAVMLDGGHIAGINGKEAFARINTGITQYYAIQGV